MIDHFHELLANQNIVKSSGSNYCLYSIYLFLYMKYVTPPPHYKQYGGKIPILKQKKFKDCLRLGEIQARVTRITTSKLVVLKIATIFYQRRTWIIRTIITIILGSDVNNEDVVCSVWVELTQY